MTIARVMVFVDAQQQAEGHVRVARAIATRFEASLIGISEFAVEPNFVAEGVIIEETTPEDVKRMKTALAEKGAVVSGYRRPSEGEGRVAVGRRISDRFSRGRGQVG